MRVEGHETISCSRSLNRFLHANEDQTSPTQLMNYDASVSNPIRSQGAQMIDAEALRKSPYSAPYPKAQSSAATTLKQSTTPYSGQTGMGDFICQRLGIKCDGKDFSEWQVFVDGMIHPENEVKIALVGKYAGLSDSYVSMTEALRHGGAACKTKVCISYLEAEKFEREPQCIKDLTNFDGIFVPYGFGPRGTEGKIAATGCARK
jgi:hypothetical protein